MPTFSSKYRHVFGTAPKPDKRYMDVVKPYTSGEGRYVASSATYWAVSVAGGGGPVYINPHAKTGRLGGDIKSINVNKGKALDFDFHPFIDNIIGVAGDDCMATVTQFNYDQMVADGQKTLTEATVTLKGHTKKAHLLKWHPTANNILTTSSWDKTVKLWNIQTEDCVQTLDRIDDTSFSMEFNEDGSLLAMSTKQGNAHLFDPRAPGNAVIDFQLCDGKKASKLFWVPTYNWIGATCFNKSAKRQLKLWDLKDTSKPIYDQIVDQQSSVLMPYYDPDTHLLFMYGKGDGSVLWWELVNDSKKVQELGMYRDPEPQKGGCFVPKRSLDTKTCEIARFLKLTRDSLIPVSLTVPRKTGADIFQSDIFPDTYAGTPSMSADEYLQGENKGPVLCSMDPAKRSSEDEEKQTDFVKKMTYAELSAENEALKSRIAELEAKLGQSAGDAE